MVSIGEQSTGSEGLVKAAASGELFLSHDVGVLKFIELDFATHVGPEDGAADTMAFDSEGVEILCFLKSDAREFLALLAELITLAFQ